MCNRKEGEFMMVISKELVSTQIDLNTKEDILAYCIDLAKKHGKLNDCDTYMNAVLKREDDFSTALGYQVAIPHGQSDAVNEPFVVVINTKEEFRWDERTENMVKLIFLIGVPMKNREKTHLEILANISRNLMDDVFRQKMIDAKNNEEAYNVLLQMESGL